MRGTLRHWDRYRGNSGGAGAGMRRSCQWQRGRAWMERVAHGHCGENRAEPLFSSFYLTSPAITDKLIRWVFIVVEGI